MSHLRGTIVPALLGVSAFLTGCGVQTSSSSTSIASISLRGNVHGGQTPVSGAHVFVLEQSTAGYGAPALDDLASHASASGVAKDSNGFYYVTTDAAGNFNFSGDYTCQTANSYLYVLALGGNPGLAAGSTNPALAEMALIGRCTTAGGTFNLPFVVDVTELTTVAAAYIFQNYLNGPLNFGYPTTADGHAQQGFVEAEQTYTNVVDIPFGQINALTSTSASFLGGGGTVPVSKFNLLANIIASCINSDGTTSACTTLFSLATTTGTTAGTKPADTLTAMLNIARNPGANIAALSALSSPAGPFQPTSDVPNDFTLAIAYPLVALNGTTQIPFNPNIPATDNMGTIWIPGIANSVGAISLVDQLGLQTRVLSPATDTAGTTYKSISRLAVDNFGYAYFTSADPTQPGLFGQYNENVITPYNSSSVGLASDVAQDENHNYYLADSVKQVVNPFSGNNKTFSSSLSHTGTWSGVALDSADDLYTVSNASGFVYLNNGNSAQAVSSAGGLAFLSQVAVDAANHVWVTSLLGTLSKFAFDTSSGSIKLVTLSPATGFTGGGITSAPGYGTSPLGASPVLYSIIPLEIDGASTIWIPNYVGQSISHFANDGTPLSPSTGFALPGCAAKGLAIDEAGNIWVTCNNTALTTPALYEFLGAATSVWAPLQSNHLGVRP